MTQVLPVLYALLAAVFYALNTPLSKLLLRQVPATLMAAFLYFGAGLGVGILYAFHRRHEKPAERLTREDLPYTAGMIVLDILAPVFLMLGLRYGTAANTALLGNFEIVATALIALVVFEEAVSKRLWVAIALITLSSIVLSFEGAGSFRFSTGSLYVLLATVFWGMENNCTRKIADKSTHEIVTLKGLFSGAGAFLIAMVLREPIPAARYILLSMLLGFVAYGLSIFLYIRAQRDLGAAKTSAYYAVAPFVGAALSFLLLHEHPDAAYFIGLVIMIAGSALVVLDTFARRHTHLHTHTFTHTHDGSTHTHTVTHEHGHGHYTLTDRHGHHHTQAELEAATGHYTIRRIAAKDNKRIEQIIRDCLIEYGGNHEGTAWADPDLGHFSEIYQGDSAAYWVAAAPPAEGETEGTVVGGVGIGPLPGVPETCELQKMYCIPAVRGTGAAQQLMDTALAFAAQHYRYCYLETLESMDRAQAFYEKYGFERVSDALGSTGHDACEVRYRKTLAPGNPE